MKPLKTNRHRSSEIMEQSSQYFPGGVNSPVRGFKFVGGHAIVFDRGEGKHLYDVDGNQYIDFCSSWGPLILGYNDFHVLNAVTQQAKKALTFGAPSETELLLAKKIKSFLPHIGMMRFVSSGTEAAMSAVRLARGYTKRKKIIKFEGCYHGHSNELLVGPRNGYATFGVLSFDGVPEGATSDTIILPFNDTEVVEKIFEEIGDQIACVIVEPLATNMGLVTPLKGYLDFLRTITRQYESLLIFDEITTGFRLARGGATEAYLVSPDIWLFGKIIGGGLPAAAFASSIQIMNTLAPLGPVYQAGTLSGCPLAMVAGITTLKRIEDLRAYDTLEKLGKILDSLVKEHLSSCHLAYVRKGSLFSFFFGTKTPPKNFKEVQACNMTIFSKVYHHLLDKGLYLGPSGYEVFFLNILHTEKDLELLVTEIKNILIPPEKIIQTPWSIKILEGPKAKPHVKDMANLRIQIFREYPYLYEGTLDHEIKYLEPYFSCPKSFVALCFENNKVIGMTTAIPLQSETKELIKSFTDFGMNPTEICYYGESVLLKEYRGRGIGHEFMKIREAYARSLKNVKYACFCSIVKPEYDPLKPRGYKALAKFWNSQGFFKVEGLTTQFTWRQISEKEESPKTMQFWMKKLI